MMIKALNVFGINLLVNYSIKKTNDEYDIDIHSANIMELKYEVTDEIKNQLIKEHQENELS